MKLTKPYFYDKFVCTANRCTDNCCIGWEIDIDDDSMKRFSAAEGDFGKRLRHAIHEHDGVHTFAFGEGERCALLREDGLCELILNMGEDSLCDICALHPRFFGWYNGVKQAGLGLCCEEVCRLLFSDSSPLGFVTEQTDEPWEETCYEETLEVLIKARETLYGILQDRQHSIAARLFSAAKYTRILQDALDSGTLPQDFTAIEEPDCEHSLCATIEALLKLLNDMESINAEWDDVLARLISRRSELASSLPEYLRTHSSDLWRYEHIAVYFCFRYFLDGVFLGEIVSRIGMMCISVLTIALMDCLTWLENGSVSEWSRILNLKLYSKQVEYSAENVELVYDAVWDIPELSPESTSAALGRQK